MDEHPLYAPFASWAKQWGVDAAAERFSSLPDIDDFVRLWHSQRDRVQFGGPIIARAGGQEWYSGPTEGDRHWTSLRRDFEAQGWGAGRLASVDDSSNLVVGHTPRPDTTHFAARGLVVGYVQSGKTTNFIAVAAKMADENYDFIIVLSGIHNGLRRQTQERLAQQLERLNPDHWLKLTDEARDFAPPTAGPSSVLSSADNKVALAVVKKNAAVLRKLLRWLDTPDGRRALQNARALVVDDEADQASVATGSINPLIRELLGLMPRHTYIGYTATPFANVFIDPNAEDLYPRDFILNLPRPEGYFGPEKIFGRPEVEGEQSGSAPDGYDMIRRIPDEDVGALRPLSRKDAETFAPYLTDDVIDAVRWFWLATAARRARGDNGHSTMLVHTSVKTDVHEELAPLFKRFTEKSRRLVADRNPAVMADLRREWEEETSKVPSSDWGRAQNTFDEILDHLDQVLEDVQVIVENSRSEIRLDFSKSPLVGIAIGGNTLSRGLTLEGLVVSVFVRGATAYDTLLQMGRWFGYRTGYEDLPRVWMTEELELGFRHLAQVEHEMRADIERYQSQNRTPLELAVRIRTHPSLQITAKMGAAERAEVSYAGSRLQTRYFHRHDVDSLAGNKEAAERLLRSANLRGEHEPCDGHHVFRGVPVADIRTFLGSYRVHEDSPDIDNRMLLDYIDRQGNRDGRLQFWNVVIVEGQGPSSVDLGPITIRSVIRARLDDGRSERADIKTLMSRKDIGLDLCGVEAAGMTETQLKERRDHDEETKDRGLVVLYAIDAHSEPVGDHNRGTGKNELRTRRAPLDAADTVIGLGLYFPGDASKDAKVRATHVAVPRSGVGDVEQQDLDDALTSGDEDDDR